MTRFIFLLIFAILFGISAPSLASMSGNDVLRECSSVVQHADSIKSAALPTAAEALDQGHCMGLMEGIISTSRTYIYISGVNYGICLPKEGVTNIQAARIVANYLKAHPEVLHKDGSVLAFAALAHSFPCASPQGEH